MARTRSKRPTLRTISEICGLAVPTVSRALNDAPDIGQATKIRVRELATQIGYVPDRAGLRLRTGKTNVIAMILGADDEVTDHVGKLVGAIAKGLHGTRYHMIVVPYFAGENLMIPVRHVVEAQLADAVILNRIEIDDPRVAYLMEREFPFVTYGRSRWLKDHSFFDFDNGWFGRAAVLNLREAGRSNMLLIAPPVGQHHAKVMIEGMQDAARRFQTKTDILPGITSDAPRQQLQDALCAHLSAHPDVDAIICPSATSAMIASVAAETVGKTLGEDFDIFAKESLDFLRHFRKSIRTLREDIVHAGEFLAQAAIQRIEDPDTAPMQELMEGTLQEAS